MRSLIVLIFVALLATSASAQWVDTTLTVAAGPWRFCHNTQNDRVYCGCFHADTVVVIDGASNSILASLAVGRLPHDLCYNPTDNKVYCEPGQREHHGD